MIARIVSLRFFSRCHAVTSHFSHTLLLSVLQRLVLIDI
jgi:hypothetical protein